MAPRRSKSEVEADLDAVRAKFTEKFKKASEHYHQSQHLTCKELIRRRDGYVSTIGKVKAGTDLEGLQLTVALFDEMIPLKEELHKIQQHERKQISSPEDPDFSPESNPLARNQSWKNDAAKQQRLRQEAKEKEALEAAARENLFKSRRGKGVASRNSGFPLHLEGGPQKGMTVVEQIAGYTKDKSEDFRAQKRMKPPSVYPGVDADPNWTSGSKPKRKAAAAQATHEPIVLSDDDDNDAGAGGRGTGAQFEPEVTMRSSRPTRSTVKVNISKQIGECSASFPAGDKEIDPVTLTSRDTIALEEGEMLNDSVVEFYIKWLQREPKFKANVGRCHFFNSFFFEKLAQVYDCEPGMRQRAAHNAVTKWTESKKRRVNIFEKDFVFFPIHQHLHWSVVILCQPKLVNEAMDLTDEKNTHHPAPYLLHLDSMSGGHKTSFVCGKLREYLAMEWARLNPRHENLIRNQDGRGSTVDLFQFTKERLPQKRMRIPQQDNGSDCGLFLLICIKKFLESMPTQLTVADVDAAHKDLPVAEGSTLDAGFLRGSWFVKELASLMRVQITEKVLEALQTGPEASSDAKQWQAIQLALENVGVNISSYEELVRQRENFATAARVKEEKLKKERESKGFERAAVEMVANKEERRWFSGQGNKLGRAEVGGGASAADFYGAKKKEEPARREVVELSGAKDEEEAHEDLDEIKTFTKHVPETYEDEEEAEVKDDAAIVVRDESEDTPVVPVASPPKPPHQQGVSETAGAVKHVSAAKRKRYFLDESSEDEDDEEVVEATQPEPVVRTDPNWATITGALHELDPSSHSNRSSEKNTGLSG